MVLEAVSWLREVREEGWYSLPLGDAFRAHPCRVEDGSGRGPGEPAWYFGFYPLPSCWPPTAPVRWLQVQLLGGRRQGQDWHYDCMVKNFSFWCFIFFKGGWGGAGFLPFFFVLTQGSQGWVITFSPLLRAMLVAGAGHQPVEGPNWDCPLLPCPGQPRLVQGFPLHIYLPLSLFSFFLPFSLLAVTPSPLHSTHPSHGLYPMAFHRETPSQTSDLHGFLLSWTNKKKVPNAARSWSRWPKLSKNRANTFPFLSQELLLLPGLSGRDRALPEVVTAEVQVGRSPLVSACSHKLQVRGGGEREK